jgi:hypothetical protein
MRQVLAIAIGLFILAVVAIGVCLWIKDLLTWRRDDRNPFRRYCRHCNQRQDMYCMDYSDGPSDGWWENMGTLNANCKVGHKLDDRL